jgi:hypothetical protein
LLADRLTATQAPRRFGVHASKGQRKRQNQCPKLHAHSKNKTQQYFNT